MQTVNAYYSLRYAADATDQDLMWLCQGCARKHADQVQWAARGHDQAECEFCDATNDPAYTAEMDALFAAVNARYTLRRSGLYW